MRNQRPVVQTTRRRPIRKNRRRDRPTAHLPLLFRLLVGVVLLLGAYGVIEASRFVPISPGQPTDATPLPTTETMPQASLDPLEVPTELPYTIPPAELPAHIPETPSTNLAETRPELAASFQRIIDRVAGGSYAPGVVLLVDIPGQGRWIGSGGFADRAAQTTVQPGDRFRIASVTKMFIATIVLQLVQEGNLRLDDPIDNWFPGLVPNGQAITIRQLLNHTSGLYDYLDGGFENIYFSQKPMRVFLPGELVVYGTGHPTYFAPGEPGRWKYSNTNYILLGMLIEAASGNSLQHELRTRIFEPVGMHNSFLEDYEAIPGGFVHGYIGDNDYSYASLSTWAAGGIVSNAEDLAAFMRALFGGRLLSDDMLREMLAWEDLSGHPVYGLGVARSIEGLSQATSGVPPRDMLFDQMWGHIGGLSGFKSVASYEPASGTVVVVLLNQMYTPVVPVAVEGMALATGRQQPTP